MKKIILISILGILISSCVKKATIDLPSPETKLVITCFLSPGTPITAVVRTSAPKFASDTIRSSDVTNASVVINDGSTSVVLTYDPNENYYVAQPADYPVTGGKTYRITVTTPDGKYANA